LKSSLGIDSAIEKARLAADSSDWKGFINAMGELFIKRKKRPLKFAYYAIVNS
jgi:hypothetical protein